MLAVPGMGLQAQDFEMLCERETPTTYIKASSHSLVYGVASSGLCMCFILQTFKGVPAAPRL